MTNDELKSIADILETALKPVKDQLDRHEAKLDSHTVSLMNIEQTLGGYADMYKVNKDKNIDLDERVTKIESHLGMPSPK